MGGERLQIQIMDILRKICVHELSLPKGGVREISIGHEANKGFYSLGVGGLQMGDLVDK